VVQTSFGAIVIITEAIALAGATTGATVTARCADPKWFSQGVCYWEPGVVVHHAGHFHFCQVHPAPANLKRKISALMMQSSARRRAVVKLIACRCMNYRAIKCSTKSSRSNARPRSKNCASAVSANDRVGRASVTILTMRFARHEKHAITITAAIKRAVDRWLDGKIGVQELIDPRRLQHIVRSTRPLPAPCRVARAC
jgi:hypothetical protein